MCAAFPQAAPSAIFRFNSRLSHRSIRGRGYFDECVGHVRRHEGRARIDGRQVALTEHIAITIDGVYRRVAYAANWNYLLGIRDPNALTDNRSPFSVTEDTRAKFIDIPVLLRYYDKGRHRPGKRFFLGIDVSGSFHSYRDGFFNGSKSGKGMADRLASTWAAFARTGDPNNDHIPPWKPYDDKDRAVMIFNVETRQEFNPRGEIRAFWDAHPVAGFGPGRG
jgi:hypothetical protein